MSAAAPFARRQVRVVFRMVGRLVGPSHLDDEVLQIGLDAAAFRISRGDPTCKVGGRRTGRAAVAGEKAQPLGRGRWAPEGELAMPPQDVGILEPLPPLRDRLHTRPYGVDPQNPSG